MVCKWHTPQAHCDVQLQEIGMLRNLLLHGGLRLAIVRVPDDEPCDHALPLQPAASRNRFQVSHANIATHPSAPRDSAAGVMQRLSEAEPA